MSFLCSFPLNIIWKLLYLRKANSRLHTFLLALFQMELRWDIRIPCTFYCQQASADPVERSTSAQFFHACCQFQLLQGEVSVLGISPDGQIAWSSEFCTGLVPSPLHIKRSTVAGKAAFRRRLVLSRRLHASHSLSLSGGVGLTLVLVCLAGSKRRCGCVRTFRSLLWSRSFPSLISWPEPVLILHG